MQNFLYYNEISYSMDKNIQNLVNLGLTEGEAKVYTALLGTGSSTVGPIVKASGVASSNIYDILERLIEKGLVSFIIKSKLVRELHLFMLKKIMLRREQKIPSYCQALNQ